MPDEVLAMIPRPQSLLADAVPAYRWLGAAVSGLEARNEHQMFIGFVPLALAAMGAGHGKNRSGSPGDGFPGFRWRRWHCWWPSPCM